MSRSKFRNILDAARSQPDADEEDGQPTQAAQTPQPAQNLASPPIVEKRRGRPPGGKRNDPNYEQVTAYIRKDIHRRVKIALLQQELKMEFSELVDQLLADWLREKA